MFRILGFAILIAAGAVCQPSRSNAEEFPVCNGGEVDGGDLIFLSRDHHRKICWNVYDGSSILRSDSFAIRNHKIQFRYVFNRGDYDPIFSAKIKTLKSNPTDVLSNEVGLYREEIVTHCGLFGRTLYRSKHLNVPGWQYQDYHKGNAKAAGEISEFHIRFKNSEGNCLNSNDKRSRLRADFALDDNLIFVRPESLASIFSATRPLHADPLPAEGKDTSPYSSVSVHIRRGQFGADFTTAAFILSQDEEFDLVLRDLSTSEGGMRRGALKLKIRK